MIYWRFLKEIIRNLRIWKKSYDLIRDYQSKSYGNFDLTENRMIGRGDIGYIRKYI